MRKYIIPFLTGIIVALVTAFWFMYELAKRPQTQNKTVIRKNKVKGKGTSDIDLNNVTEPKKKRKNKFRIFKRKQVHNNIP